MQNCRILRSIKVFKIQLKALKKYVFQKEGSEHSLD